MSSLPSDGLLSGLLPVGGVRMPASSLIDDDNIWGPLSAPFMRLQSPLPGYTTLEFSIAYKGMMSRSFLPWPDRDGVPISFQTDGRRLDRSLCLVYLLHYLPRWFSIHPISF